MQQVWVWPLQAPLNYNSSFSPGDLSSNSALHWCVGMGLPAVIESSPIYKWRLSFIYLLKFIPGLLLKNSAEGPLFPKLVSVLTETTDSDFQWLTGSVY